MTDNNNNSDDTPDNERYYSSAGLEKKVKDKGYKNALRDNLLKRRKITKKPAEQE